MITTIDLDARQRKRDMAIKKIQKENLRAKTESIIEAKQLRSHWLSPKSDLILYARLMTDYLQAVNKGRNFFEKERLMEKFCTENRI